jgi:hypothetical protein
MSDPVETASSVIAMRTILALLLGLGVVAGCESARHDPNDVFDGGEPLYIAQCAHPLPGLACE